MTSARARNWEEYRQVNWHGVVRIIDKPNHPARTKLGLREAGLCRASQRRLMFSGASAKTLGRESTLVTLLD